MKQWKWIAALVIGGVVATAVVQLQAQAAMRTRATTVVTCDISQVFRDYQKGKDLSVKMDQRQVALGKEDNFRKTAIESAKKALGGFAPGSEQYQKALAELQKKMIDHEVWARVQQQTLLQDQVFQTKAMRKEILAVIETLSTQRGFDVVIQMNASDSETRTPQELIAQIAGKKVLYSAKSVNITPMVIAELNRRYAASR